ncbi:MAG: oligopeptide transporter, OPT family [Candidatus Eremiobacteraeota bacterium]|nr:oligopeptide transporter, OPT family [Candidatus Eremiobacteraeota bacterium]
MKGFFVASRSDSLTPTTSNDRRVELTVRGIILGALITVVFTAANVYVGLKVGLTFASSIPAAVISMAVLRAFRSSTIWENNIVQTVASAAGTLSSIIFVLPGLVMVGWWTGFPFWYSFLICAVGGILGVMYSVPLRRAMVTGSDLPYPEGVAAAEVLRVGAGVSGTEAERSAAIAENKFGLSVVIWGAVVSAAYGVLVFVRGLLDDVGKFARIGASATGIDIGLQFALIGVGHLVGVTVGVAMLAGIVLAWGVLVPIMTAHHAALPDAAAFANGVWRREVRLVGAGAIAVAAIWSLGRLAGPVVGGVISSLAANRERREGRGGDLPITERDIPFNIVVLISVACLLPLAALLGSFLSGTALASQMVPLVIGALAYTMVAGLIVAAVCGYMAGLIGSSNSPVSGLAILTILGAALLLVAVANPSDPNAAKALVAYALFVTAVIINVATISNDNLQDLKTGQLVGATPWRQQVALIFGVIFGALVIPPVLNLLNHSFGFAGSPIHGITNQPLSAPQATLISALANGVIAHNLNWQLIGIGGLVGLVIVGIDETLRRTAKRQFPPLAVALGIYLPMSVTLMVVVGAFAGKAYNTWVSRGKNPDVAMRLGILLASGLIVGEGLLGVAKSGLIAATNKEFPFAIAGDSFEPIATVASLIAFPAIVFLLYRWAGRLALRL